MTSPAKPAGTRTVRKQLADGTVKEYTYSRAAKPKARPTEPASDNLRALIAAYERSPEWHALAPRTVKNRLIALRPLASIGHLRVTEWRRRDILLLRDAIAMARGPAAGNAFASAVATLFAWARDRGWIEHSPADRIRALPGGAYPTWTEAHLARALQRFAEPARRAIVLAVHTGQRRGDLVSLRWSNIAGGVLRLVQEKTGAVLALPIHPDLARELAAWRAKSAGEHILTHDDGTAWDRDHLTMLILRERRAAGLPEALNLHGLRKLAAVRLAQAGCSTHEIAAFTGHQTLAEVARYTAAADQERLAESAAKRLGNRPVSTARKPQKSA
jgi:integrase